MADLDSGDIVPRGTGENLDPELAELLSPRFAERKSVEREGLPPSYRMRADAHYVDPEAYLATAPSKDGSWWPEWVAWLNARSGVPIDPPEMGAAAAGYAPLCNAPGRYVLQE